LFKPDGVIIHQEIKATATGNNYNGLVYHYGREEAMLKNLMAAKDSENKVLKNEIKSLRDEIKYLREKIDQLLTR
jgi:hypothetical protein